MCSETRRQHKPPPILLYPERDEELDPESDPDYHRNLIDFSLLYHVLDPDSSPDLGSKI